MKKLHTLVVCVVGALAPSIGLAGGLPATPVNKTCQFPTTNGTTTGLFGNWPPCGDPSPLVSIPHGQCFFLTDVTLANNNVAGHLVVLNDGNHPGSDTTQYPYALPLGTTVQDFTTPLVFKGSSSSSDTGAPGLYVYDRSNGSPPQNPNVWVTVSGYYSVCPLVGP
jgi:hypothetical protein